MGAARDNDCIDFTDNDIAQLANFPLSPRLRTLLLARNRVASIQPTLHKSIPGLTTLVLTSNRFAELADLDPLKNFASLTHLTLVENPVTRKEVRCKYEFEGSNADWNTELPILDPMEVPRPTIPGLPEGQSGRTREGRRALRNIR